MNVLVVGAHPDDEILGVGGTMSRHVDRGDQVYVYLLTDGHSSRDSSDQQAVAKRRHSAIDACKVVGVKSEHILIDTFPDQGLDNLPLVELVKRMEVVKDKWVPDVVYFHHHGDVNFDHQVVSRAAITAFRPVGKNIPVAIYAYETLSSTEWGGPYASSHFIPNYFVDVTATIERKIAAMKCYSQELRPFPHPRSLEGIEIAAKRWGTVVGVRYAEAFFNVRTIWF